MARVTLIDIAKKAGVSRTTASYVLNQNPSARISVETRERVLQVMRELDYQPNLVAKSLRTQRTQTIGVMVVNMLVRNFMITVKGIHESADNHHFHVLLADTQGKKEKEIDHIRFLAQKNIDGLIIIAATRNADPRLPDLLDDLAIPTVFVNQPYSEDGLPIPAPVVLVDYERAMYDAVTYLIQLGHQAIGFLGADLPNLSVKLRRDGYSRAMHEAGITVQPEWVIAQQGGFSTYRFGERLAPQLIGTGVTAIVAVNDEVAAAVVHTAQKRGIDVPQQLSVIGHDDRDTVRYLQPRLTTVRHPLEQLGTAAFDMLFDFMEDPEWAIRPLQPVVLTSELVVRQSTAKRGF